MENWSLNDGLLNHTARKCIAQLIKNMKMFCVAAISKRLLDKFNDKVITNHLVIASSMEFVRACPRCRFPVTFGGGMHITN